MASATSFFLFCLVSCNFLGTFAARESRSNNTNLASQSLSGSFPLTSTSLSRGGSARNIYLSSRRLRDAAVTAAGTPSLNYKSSFKYSMALVVTLPIGTPAQDQQMVLDTGSQLSWIQCHKKAPPETTSFDPSLSSSFSVLPCNHPMCKPRIPDFTLPTSCDQKQLCHYSYFYADGTYAEGNLVREKVSFSDSQTTPPMVLGCATESGQAEGILGMNRGRLSFASQAKVQRFSYCVPVRRGDHAIKPTGTFYLGRNPNSGTFQYINMLTFSRSQRMPNLDPLAYTVALSGIKIGGKKLNIPPSVFRPDAGGSGQTMIDSGTEYTFLVEAAYNTIREEVVRLAGAKLKKGYVYGGSLDMCFDGNNPAEIGNLIGDMAFEFDNGAEILIGKDRILDGVGRGIHCLGIGRSESLGVASNIIGNFHQQNLWVEFDLVSQRVGFVKADCSRA